MAFNLIFNDNDTGVAQDTLAILACINNFFAQLGVHNVEVNTDGIDSILRGMRQDFPHIDGIENASPFKKAANFLCYFVASSPVHTPLPDLIRDPKTELGAMLRELQSDPTSAIIGYFIASEALHGAKIESKAGKTLVLNSKIELSNHSYADLVGALCKITPTQHFAMVAVLLEQMAYKTNPHCQYPHTP